MADKKANGTTPPVDGEGAKPTFQILAQYIKDLSFESPDPVKHLKKAPEKPESEVNINVSCNSLEQNTFEVAVQGHVRIFSDKETIFLIEITYAGIFNLENFPDDLKQIVLFVECPRLLFPFFRTLIAQVTQESGFPAFYMPPIDFADLLRRRLEGEKNDATVTQ
jgi:preprotein translocase subunit SecB